ncbi:glycoside hydrolase family 3 protein [Gemmatimonas sp.]|uniref:glycoside hydrolase family 3 protein n=1 Tax=Gemmatimonas sp. TaxID=1962908 RepID=UPI00286DD7BD|nr:glycoside hydrolase family 3 protein [Gemmatimonas sp.]
MTTMTRHEIVAERAESLLARMSLAQKLGQMIMSERMATTPDDVRDFHLGSVLSGGGSAPGANTVSDWVAMNDAYWAASMSEANGRLPIPLLYAVDAVHGHANVLGATVFPHNIGLGCARDPELVERTARVMAKEVLATGVDWTFAPTLAVAQNIHWGRTYESFSEDPALVASYAAGYVRGVQHDLGTDGVIACAKHWVGDGGTTAGNDQGDTAISQEALERTHMSPYYPALEAGLLTVMASFNSWNGDKCHGHRYLLTDVLKGRLGFDGLVVSDWDGVDYLHEDYGTAIGMAVNAGMDVFMVSLEWKRCLELLQQQVEAGIVPMSRIDDAVLRILSVKLRFGLFEKPRPAERAWSKSDSFGSAAHRDIAREAVRKSLVLLKNEHALLPLSRAARILVAGKSAHNRGHQCGGFTVAWQGETTNDAIVGGTSIWEGIQALAPMAALDVTGASADPAHHDVAIVVIGEKPYAEGMGDLRLGGRVEKGSHNPAKPHNLAPYGKSIELAQLHPEDLALITAIASKGISVVTVFVGGRPLVVNAELDASQAFVAAWLPGSEGQGVADVLLGDYPFHGTLSFTWPQSTAPSYKDEAPRFARGYGITTG